MAIYTADAVSLLVYLVDALPEPADRAFAEAEAGETLLQTPGTALAETLYAVSRDKNVRGVSLSGTPDATRQALVANGPVSVAPVDDAVMAEYARLVSDFDIHDGLVVASHRAAETDAIITSDEAIRASEASTIWD